MIDQKGEVTVTSADTENRCGNPKCNEINCGIDECIKPIIEALNDGGVKTIASCCGHGNRPGNIALADGRELIIAENYEQGREIDKYFSGIHGGQMNEGTLGN